MVSTIIYNKYIYKEICLYILKNCLFIFVILFSNLFWLTNFLFVFFFLLAIFKLNISTYRCYCCFSFQIWYLYNLVSTYEDERFYYLAMILLSVFFLLSSIVFVSFYFKLAGQKVEPPPTHHNHQIGHTCYNINMIFFISIGHL